MVATYQGAVKIRVYGEGKRNLTEVRYFRMGEVKQYIEYLAANSGRLMSAVWTDVPMGESGLAIKLKRIVEKN
jgi:hypothetical protein